MSRNVSERFTSSIVLDFPHLKKDLRKIQFEGHDGQVEYTSYRLMPRVADWPASKVPDGPNPRSHGPECLESGVAREIEKTLTENPQDFHLANRGGCLLVHSLRFDPDAERIRIELDDLALHGMADGATTNAVIEQVQDELGRSECKIHHRNID